MSAEARARAAEAARDSVRAELDATEAASRALKRKLAAMNRSMRAHYEAANAECRWLDALFIVAQAGYAYDLRFISGLCCAARSEEALASALSRVQYGVKKRTHLMHAATRGDVGRVRWLTARGAPLDLRDSVGWTALMHASHLDGSEQCHTGVVRALLDAGAGINLSSIDGTTALMLACTADAWETVPLLLERGADATAASVDQCTALHFVSEPDFSKWLLDARAKVDAQDSSGNTPLHVAAKHGHVYVARVLVAAGASVDKQNAFGRTPLHEACSSEDFATALLLSGAGASSAIPDLVGQTALSIATGPILSMLGFAEDAEVPQAEYRYSF
jgi:ankyrin repeat protein